MSTTQTTTDDETKVFGKVFVNDDGMVDLLIYTRAEEEGIAEPITMPPANARRIAAAIWDAADRAEGTQQQ